MTANGQVMFANIADMADPCDPVGRSFRQVNLARSHAISIGALVELETGARVFVVKHTRDCDLTPLYSLSAEKLDEDGPTEIDMMKWLHGYGEENLLLVAAP